MSHIIWPIFLLDYILIFNRISMLNDQGKYRWNLDWMPRSYIEYETSKKMKIEVTEKRQEDIKCAYCDNSFVNKNNYRRHLMLKRWWVFTQYYTTRVNQGELENLSAAFEQFSKTQTKKSRKQIVESWLGPKKRSRTDENPGPSNKIPHIDEAEITEMKIEPNERG